MVRTNTFNKEEFKKDIKDNCKLLYRKNIDECDDQQKFQAVAYSVKNIIIDKWIATHKEYEKQDVKDCLLYVYGIPDGPCARQQHD